MTARGTKKGPRPDLATDGAAALREAERRAAAVGLATLWWCWCYAEHRDPVEATEAGGGASAFLLWMSARRREARAAHPGAFTRYGSVWSAEWWWQYVARRAFALHGERAATQGESPCNDDSA